MNSIVTQNRLQFWDYLMRQGSFQRYPEAHVLAAKSPSHHDPFFNYVFAYDKSCYQSTPEIVDFFQGACFHWWVQPHQTAFGCHLKQHGFHLNLRVQGMHRLLARAPQYHMPSQIHIERVSTHQQRADWMNLWTQALNTPHQTLDRLCPQTQQNTVVMYLGSINKTPASVCVAFYGTTSVGIYWLATLPEFRGRGVAHALLETVVHDAYQRRYQSITLQAAPSAVPLYERLGFQSIEQYNLYLWDKKKATQARKKSC